MPMEVLGVKVHIIVIIVIIIVHFHLPKQDSDFALIYSISHQFIYDYNI